MSDDDKLTLRPASPEEIEQSLSYALRYDGRKRVRQADDAMARITAERLVRHLLKSGYVHVMWNSPNVSSLEGPWLPTFRYRSAGRS